MIHGTRSGKKMGVAAIDWLGQSIVVRPVHPSLIKVLSSIRHVAVKDPVHGCRSQQVLKPLFRHGRLPTGEQAVFCTVALEPVVRKVLTAAGLVVLDVGQPHQPLPDPQHDLLADFGTIDETLLGSVEHHERALIKYKPARVDPAVLIAQIILAWPDLTVAIATKRIQTARELRNRVAKYLPNVVAVTSQNLIADENVGRVVVATYMGLGHTGIEIEKRNIVIALNATEALSEQSRWCLKFAQQARLYGLLDRNEKPSPHNRDRLAELFGFHEVVIPEHGSQERPVLVASQQIKNLDRLPNELNLLALKREGIWQNALRNQQIAGLAQLLQHGDRHEVERQYPAVAEGLEAMASLRVLLLVENVEHGQALQQFLPDWPLITGPSVWKKGVRRDTNMPEPPKAMDARPFAIATFAGLPSIRLNDVDVLLRTDGGMDLPPILDSDLVQPATESPRPLVLIDVDDRHHPRLRGWTEKRRAAYAERSWWPVGMDPVEARVEAFLNDRPGRAA